MKKAYWVGIVIIVILVIAIGYYEYSKSNADNIKTQDIESMNQAQYNFLNCISNCPIVYYQNQSSIKQSCLSDCSESNINATKFASKYPSDQLIKDPLYVSCANNVNPSDALSLEKFQGCLIKVMPALKLKYSYLK